jgi:hypothetical protein
VNAVLKLCVSTIRAAILSYMRVKEVFAFGRPGKTSLVRIFIIFESSLVDELLYENL